MLQTFASSKYKPIRPALQRTLSGGQPSLLFDKDHGEGNKANGISPDRSYIFQLRRRRDRTVQIGPTCAAGEMEKSLKDSKTQTVLSSGLINDTFMKLYICTYTV